MCLDNWKKRIHIITRSNVKFSLIYWRNSSALLKNDNTKWTVLPGMGSQPQDCQWGQVLPCVSSTKQIEYKGQFLHEVLNLMSFWAVEYQSIAIFLLHVFSNKNFWIAYFVKHDLLKYNNEQRSSILILIFLYWKVLFLYVNSCGPHHNLIKYAGQVLFSWFLYYLSLMFRDVE